MDGTLAEQMQRLAHRLAELERRVANQRRTGVVTAADPAAGRWKVRLRDGMITGWLPAQEIAAGAIRIWAPPSLGEQVVIASESGDLADAEIIGRLPSAAHPSPHDREAELVIAIGSTRLTLTPSAIEMRSDDFRLAVSGFIDFEQD